MLFEYVFWAFRVGWVLVFGVAAFAVARGYTPRWGIKPLQGLAPPAPGIEAA